MPPWPACRLLCPRRRKLTTNRLTFAAFPIMGYSMTSDTIPQTTLWQLATYK